MTREADAWFQWTLERIRTQNERVDEAWAEVRRQVREGVEFNDYVYGGDE